MGKNNTIILLQFAVLAIVLTIVKEATSIPICNIDTNDLEKCRAAVSGNNPPAPGPDCCAVARSVNLQCLCPYKPYLSSFGINPSKVRPLLAKCGINSPPSCFSA
ncbi:PREDICTED: putative lipid-transfer protein DIR1 [Camelina sativa]|uniref:Lipid-transfer protein DIR1 n=1 Tax=Camelina sativa TaxID=90675 RepID=A0ABM0V241_CAMSA|nr:PREDICTED: putative lipid-transfer protein DIR1 [Camelina sativa]